MHKIPPYPTYPEDKYFDHNLLYDILSNKFVIVACCMVGISAIVAILAMLY